MSSDYMLDDMLEVAYTGSATLTGVATMGGGASFTIAGGTVSPRPLVEIAFTTDPTSEIPIWTDVTEYTQSFNIRRGRQRELDVIEPGTASFLLDNDDRRFDPSNTAGPYYPNILPVRRIRVRAIWDNVVYNVFSGYIGGWPQEYPGKHRNTVSLEAVDALGFLSFAEITASRASELTGSRITAILNLVDWPAADRAVDVGQETLAAVTDETGSGLSMLQDISATEMGRLFADKAGKITFHGRDRILSNPPAPSGTWSDDDGGPDYAYDDLTPDQDEGEIYNRVTMTRRDGLPQVVEDATSRTQFFLRDYSQSDLLLLSDADALARAQYVLSQRKDPLLRFNNMTVDARADGAYAPVLSLELGDSITVERFTADPPTITREVFVDGIEVDSNRDDKSWTMSFSLTPVPAINDWWIVGVSILGVDTRLAL